MNMEIGTLERSSLVAYHIYHLLSGTTQELAKHRANVDRQLAMCLVEYETGRMLGHQGSTTLVRGVTCVKQIQNQG